MSILRFIVIFLFVWVQIRAQVTFCPAGAEWHYSFHTGNIGPYPSFENESIKYSGDTIVGNDTLKILVHMKFYVWRGWPVQRTLIKQNGDTIFMKNIATANQWQVLYNFAAQVGDHWTNSLGPNAIQYTTTVVSTGTVSLANKSVKTLSVSYQSNENYAHSGAITEYLGSNHFLFNYWSNLPSSGPVFNAFLCYQDAELGLLTFTDKACDYTTLSSIEQPNLSSIAVFPRPMNDVLYITGAENALALFFDQYGKVVYKRAVMKDETINTEALVPGIYVLQIWQDNNLVYKSKIIKQNN